MIDICQRFLDNNNTTKGYDRLDVANYLKMIMIVISIQDFDKLDVANEENYDSYYNL